MKIIPAIDIIDGQCVRLTEGVYDSVKIYNRNPLEQAKIFEGMGFKYLHLVDLDGAKAKSIQNQDVLYNICKSTSLIVDFGGGIKSEQDVQIAFNSGASQITLGSLAVSDPNLFQELLARFGEEKIILGADCKDRMVATNGWLDSSSIDVIDFINRWAEKGIKYVVCTDIAKDGKLEGPSFDLYKEVKGNSNIRLIASGGVTSMEDIIQLNKLGCYGAIIGKAIYENKIDIKKLAELC